MSSPAPSVAIKKESSSELPDAPGAGATVEEQPTSLDGFKDTRLAQDTLTARR